MVTDLRQLVAMRNKEVESCWEYEVLKLLIDWGKVPLSTHTLVMQGSDLWFVFDKVSGKYCQNMFIRLVTIHSLSTAFTVILTQIFLVLKNVFNGSDLKLDLNLYTSLRSFIQEANQIFRHWLTIFNSMKLTQHFHFGKKARCVVVMLHLPLDHVRNEGFPAYSLLFSTAIYLLIRPETRRHCLEKKLTAAWLTDKHSEKLCS